MFKKVSTVFILGLNTVFCSAQQVRPSKSSEIYRELKTLKQLPKVLYLAAHPDDENTGLLSWLINDQNVETGYLSLTRGDGGQNLLGTEQGAALGLIRTHELLEARKLDGARQFFTRAIDFGFSKNTTDTFKQWNADSITADVVWVIRQFRPDVIICRFPPTAAAGHGQHAASAVVAEKAFKLAGDKNAFPDQLKYVNVWQPKRVLWNTFRFGGVNTTAENQLKVTVGQYDPKLGMGYGELAGLSRSLHKSQGAGTQSVAGIRTEYFAHVSGEPAKETLFDGVPKTWTSQGNADIDQSLDKIISAFSFNNPDLSLPALLALRKKIVALKDADVKKDKLKSLDHIIVSCVGFMGEVVTNQAEAVAGNHYNFRLNLISRAADPVVLENVKWVNQSESFNRKLSKDSLITLQHDIQIPEDAALTEPYWLAKPPVNAATFSVPNDTLVGLPEAESPLNVLLGLKIGSEKFQVQLPLSFKKLDPVRGDVVEALRIVPALELKFTQPLYLVREDEDLQLNLNVKVNSNKPYRKGVLNLMYNGERLGGADVSLNNGKDTTINYVIPKTKLAAINSARWQLDASFVADGATFNKKQVLIQYPHLPSLQYFAPATVTVMKGDIQAKIKKVGYIEGAGDFIPEFLRIAGIQVDVLKDEDFYGNSDESIENNSRNKLSQYDAIILGVRANNTEKKLGRWMPFLWSYAKAGGNLVMQYNTNQDTTVDQLGMYNFSIANKRVTEENASVKFLNPGHKLLNFPNKITADDFKGWVQERGAYFPAQWDAAYEPLFEMYDTGEEPLQGSTLYAKYGKGNFIYTPLAFFRQLPAGNVGAARLFFNFLSAQKN
ncbi:PIG-L family deacetylase [Chryseobacterium indologenes]|uniref:PIG-L family deacetylase n=1 Tax=Chryseobacterium indologenes TaxID=253 RepID=UPI000BFE3EE5|nr:PIG-L family deacetylase [Chryseobacterium indologenes]ATN05823.1 PIG-L family deacetylase [Chryseobacterium indologenes]AYY85418.1 PIG-L family deacetylase [Chryseobacterium indologenes]QIX82313.1 PIG-L family deacetylase [Chryseobacterium indologenes]UDQ56160.1 PIG-L family deacetylase [Chryseobacterium indologenes]